MYACAKFVTSPAVVSKLNLFAAEANGGTTMSRFGDVSTISKIWNSDADSWAKRCFKHLYRQGHGYDWRPYLSHALVSVAIYWHLCQLTLLQSAIPGHGRVLHLYQPRHDPFTCHSSFLSETLLNCLFLIVTLVQKCLSTYGVAYMKVEGMVITPLGLNNKVSHLLCSGVAM